MPEGRGPAGLLDSETSTPKDAASAVKPPPPYDLRSENTSISVAVDPPVYEQIKQLAASRGVSLSIIARDLINEALVMGEDAALARLAAEREATLRNDTALSHEEVWD